MLHIPDRTSWTWRFSIEADATAECSMDGGPWSPCASPLPGGASGRTVRFEVRAVDRAGNRSAITRTTVTPTMAPAVVGPPPPPPPPRDARSRASRRAGPGRRHRSPSPGPAA